MGAHIRALSRPSLDAPEPATLLTRASLQLRVEALRAYKPLTTLYHTGNGLRASTRARKRTREKALFNLNENSLKRG